MKTIIIRNKVREYLSSVKHPKSTIEILQWVNKNMYHGTTTNALANVLAKDKNITKVTAKYKNVRDLMLLMAFAQAAGIMGSRGK